jgi:hypothetical protein
VPRWSLKFWPDTREMVDDLFGHEPRLNSYPRDQRP